MKQKSIKHQVGYQHNDKKIVYLALQRTVLLNAILCELIRVFLIDIN
jgi:hypothetical protein